MALDDTPTVDDSPRATLRNEIAQEMFLREWPLHSWEGAQGSMRARFLDRAEAALVVFERHTPLTPTNDTQKGTT